MFIFGKTLWQKIILKLKVSCPLTSHTDPYGIERARPTQSVGSTIWQLRLKFKPRNQRLSLTGFFIVSAADLRQEKKGPDEEMKQSFCLIIVVVLLFGASVVQGMS